MKIIQYILFTGIVVTLWVTAPIWMPTSKYNTTTTTSEIDTFFSHQKEERNALLKAHDKQLASIENKFGKKSSIMPSLKAHWAKIYTKNDAFQLSKCYNIREGTNGWSIHCTYRVKGDITQTTYIINNGNISQ
jgi:hypothetical protein